MVKPTKPVDIYIRVSRVGGRENLISPEEQERRARELASERGLVVGVVLTDLDESGGKLERPGLQEALARVEGRHSGGVIVAWLDRLSRDSEQALGLVRRIQESGGAIYAPDAPSDWTTPEGELQAGIFFAFAQYIRSKSRAGFERAKERAIANGIPVHSRAPVGYRPRADRRLEPDPETAPVVREVFEGRARGDGPAALGALLERHGVPTSQGSTTWSKPAVYGLLKNRVYLGELHYGKDGRFVNPGAHEAIVDLALFQAAQNPKGHTLTAPRSESAPYLLAGIVRCAGCGYCLQGTTTSRGKRIYRCTRTRAGGLCPAPARVYAGPLEEAVLADFWGVIGELQAESHVADDPHIGDLEQALEKAESRLAQYKTVEVQDALGPAEWAAGLKERREDVERMAEELGSARAARAPSLPIATVDLRERWQSMSTAQRREYLGAYVETVSLSRDRVVVAYPHGTAPEGLPRRGYRREPGLVPFGDKLPAGARVLSLEVTAKQAGNTSTG